MRWTPREAPTKLADPNPIVAQQMWLVVDGCCEQWNPTTPEPGSHAQFELFLLVVVRAPLVFQRPLARS